MTLTVPSAVELQFDALLYSAYLPYGMVAVNLEQLEEFALFDDMMSEEAVPIAGLRVVAWLDGDGGVRYQVAVHGDMPTSAFLGYMEMAKHDYLAFVDAAQEEDE